MGAVTNRRRPHNHESMQIASPGKFADRPLPRRQLPRLLPLPPAKSGKSIPEPGDGGILDDLPGMWSTREQLAGLRVVRRNADGSLAQAHGGTPAVTEKSKGKLLVEWPMDDGRKLTILLSEEGMEIAVSGKGPDWMLELTAAPGAALPFTAFGARRIAAVQKGFAYAFDCTKGTIATDGTSTGSIFVLHPSDGKISLKFK